MFAKTVHLLEQQEYTHSYQLFKTNSLCVFETCSVHLYNDVLVEPGLYYCVILIVSWDVLAFS